MTGVQTCALPIFGRRSQGLAGDDDEARQGLAAFITADGSILQLAGLGGSIFDVFARLRRGAAFSA